LLGSGELTILLSFVGASGLLERLLLFMQPNGFINIKISSATLTSSLSKMVTCGVCGPRVEQKKVLVDFSSPNIAKDMHVGHLRSTIIGDSICRVLEFCGHEVMRVNHVGDWGTQFGMLITFLQDSYPDIHSNPPSIGDLNALYKASKKRFDEDADFKERSRLNVVKLQSGDPACISLWNMLCDISRAEFQVVYDVLGVHLKEVGESFYNPMLPGTIEELKQLGLIEEDQGMLIVRLQGYDIPLIARKSDGGYGYDSTDLAAVSYRIRELKR
jgi:arginyl-tRNA synthetase